MKAEQQLRAALPLAAAANSDDGSWNSLMTTISEGATVDEGHLVPALQAQCVVADTNPNVNPQNPANRRHQRRLDPQNVQARRRRHPTAEGASRRRRRDLRPPGRHDRPA